MMAYQEAQNSGISWAIPETKPLYQPARQPALWREPGRAASVGGLLEKQMAEFAAGQAFLNELKKHYVVQDSSALDFLTEYSVLLQILVEAVVPLRACFGNTAVFQLRAPIDEAGSRTLYAEVIWPGEAGDAWNALAGFDRTWWMSRAAQAGGHLTFTYELI
jgi:hypothetical protein